MSRPVCEKHPYKACQRCGSSPGWATRTTFCMRRGSRCGGTMPNYTDRKPCYWCERECPTCGAVQGSIACVESHAA